MNELVVSCVCVCVFLVCKENVFIPKSCKTVPEYQNAQNGITSIDILQFSRRLFLFSDKSTRSRPKQQQWQQWQCNAKHTHIIRNTRHECNNENFSVEQERDIESWSVWWSVHAAPIQRVWFDRTNELLSTVNKLPYSFFPALLYCVDFPTIHNIFWKIFECNMPFHS